MLERTDSAGLALRPASLLEALRERTRDLHVQAERSGIIADILKGRCTREDYVRLLRSLLPVYQMLEQQLRRRAGSSSIAPIFRPELERAEALSGDLRHLSPGQEDQLPAVERYVSAIVAASDGDGSRLVAHAYARYLGDLSGGQILSRLLARSLGLPPEALSFYAFPAISDIGAFKSDYRAAIDRAGDECEDFDAVVEEGARAFELNIDLSVALQADIAGALRN
ncbi:heme oxygenase (biliverdin-producing) [Bradyrhizobium sp.]|uniref:biliverdin-producing heme oxygenase n=1 Tax=Bradyrhizobium sp. TaxID=376 RepID=UPI0039E486BF